MINSIIRTIFRSRLKAAASWATAAEDVQRRELAAMVRAARDTEFGRQHNFSKIASYADFRDAVPEVMSYEVMRPLVMRMIAGEPDVLWRGKVRNFAQSSGTSDGRSKYIPITADGFRRCHYRGTYHSVAHYLDNVSSSRLFRGKALILGGSFANELTLQPGVCVGDLSANLIDRMNRLAGLLRVPSRKIALMADWKEKLPALAAATAADRHVTNISGVPSWMLEVLKEVLRIKGADCLHDVWPNLEVFFHGGIAFGPYREQYQQITNQRRMHYLENYNASEGFFAVQNDLADPAMLLLLDAGTFYEFIPLSDIDSDNPRLLPAWEVEQGRVYALVITNVNGLWRYPIGDTVRIESVSPLKITIAGRTRHFINAFGEELMVCNADRAIEAASRDHNCQVVNYTAAPVYPDAGHRGRHQWLIEFATPPESLAAFGATLDRYLQAENSDYQAKRASGLFLDAPEICIAAAGLFDRWLESKGKLGGQHKIPRLSNDRAVLDELLASR
ncbi:MAG: GH3 auxin-responsive promoter family protein [Muribaculaceae bacterium]|nr:GH3 auxin-responsive promoter family protein [Muribaculaceae bacterium]